MPYAPTNDVAAAAARTAVAKHRARLARDDEMAKAVVHRVLSDRTPKSRKQLLSATGIRPAARLAAVLSMMADELAVTGSARTGPGRPGLYYRLRPRKETDPCPPNAAASAS